MYVVYTMQASNLSEIKTYMEVRHDCVCVWVRVRACLCVRVCVFGGGVGRGLYQLLYFAESKIVFCLSDIKLFNSWIYLLMNFQEHLLEKNSFLFETVM